MTDLSEIVNSEFTIAHPIRAGAVAEIYAGIYARHPYFHDGDRAGKFLQAAKAAIYSFAVRSDGMPRLGFNPDLTYAALKLTLQGYSESEAADLLGIGEPDLRLTEGEALHITGTYISGQNWGEKYLLELEQIAAGKGYRKPRPSESFLLGIIREGEQKGLNAVLQRIRGNKAGKDTHPQRESPYINNPLYHHPIRNSGISAQTRHSLTREPRMEVLGELTLVAEHELLSREFPNIGTAGVEEARKCLGYGGMALRGEEPYIFPQGDELLKQPASFLFPKAMANRLAGAGLASLGQAADNQQLVRKILGRDGLQEFYQIARSYKLIPD